MTEFLKVINSDQFIGCLERFPRLEPVKTALDLVLNRVLAEDIIAPENLPIGPRSTVDGYAVRAADTFGASDSGPALLEIAGAVDMGCIPDLVLRGGQAAHISTGGFLPRGADAVVMVEYTTPAGAGSVEITRPVTERTNVLDKAEDAAAGEMLISSGRVFRPYEIGLLAALGITEVLTYPLPRVAVISTGDEVISIEQQPLPGQIRDANAHSVAALVRSAGGVGNMFPVIPDDAAQLRSALESALADSDVVALSGGSSVGTRDLMVEVAAGLPGAEMLAHGISIRPGKPTLLVKTGGKAIFGLPGHPVSALIVAQVFLAPFLRYLQGAGLVKGPAGRRLNAVLATSIHSPSGLEEYVRVRLEKTSGGDWSAHPVFGKSGMLSTLVKADGVVIVPLHQEGIARGQVVEVVLI